MRSLSGGFPQPPFQVLAFQGTFYLFCFFTRFACGETCKKEKMYWGHPKPRPWDCRPPAPPAGSHAAKRAKEDKRLWGGHASCNPATAFACIAQAAAHPQTLH